MGQFYKSYLIKTNMQANKVSRMDYFSDFVPAIYVMQACDIYLFLLKSIFTSLHLFEINIFFFSCVHEYMDVYAEVVQPDPAELINSPFGGRYCGNIPPRRRVSLYRAIALAFYTDKNVTNSELFSGRYTFINDCKFCQCLII